MKNIFYQLPLEKLINPILFISMGALLRLTPHPANVAPIAAMALFGGVYVNKKYALIVPFLALFISDIFLGFYKEMPFVYGSFLLIGLLGLQLRKSKSIKNVIMTSLFSSLLFFIITNFGVWLLGSTYSKDIKGIITCYTYAIPFFRNTIIGDLLYVGLLFGAYEFAVQLFAKKKIIKAKTYGR